MVVVVVVATQPQMDSMAGLVAAVTYTAERVAPQINHRTVVQRYTEIVAGQGKVIITATDRQAEVAVLAVLVVIITMLAQQVEGDMESLLELAEKLCFMAAAVQDAVEHATAKL
jgi:predicted regulator of Ras-like GTPase activity (Roadblock/LC7/MglB family)